jgi:phosphopentomutase
MHDIVDGEGITKTIKSSSTNIDTINKLTDIMDKNFTGLCITNLNEFEIAGNTKNIEEYARMIEEFDVEVPMILNKLNNDDLLIITADHGNDPTFEGNYHTRENLPVIVFGRNFKTTKKLPILNSLADIGATIANNFDVPATNMGTSFLEQLK